MDRVRVSIGIVYASTFFSTAIHYCFASCLCMVLDLEALALIFIMDTIEWAYYPDVVRTCCEPKWQEAFTLCFDFV